jgi:hypothetical protein
VRASLDIADEMVAAGPEIPELGDEPVLHQD